MHNISFALVLLTSCFGVFTTSTVAQIISAPAKPQTTIKGDSDIPRISLKKLAAGEIYRSIEGRFQINLPKMISSYAAKTPKDLGFPGSGASMTWNIQEAHLRADYFDLLEGRFQGLTTEEIQRLLDSSVQGGLAQTKGTLLSVERVELQGHLGRKTKTRHSNGTILLARTYFVNARVYIIAAGLNAETAEYERLVEKSLDTFKLISQEEIDKEIADQVLKNSPKPLPQSPVGAKEKSDLNDENLKGRVKTVVIEDQDLSGTWQSQVRHRSSESHYNELGYEFKSISYDAGVPFEISVFGFIDKARVSRSKILGGLSSGVITTAGPSNGKARPRDVRYDYKYTHKYIGDRLAEKMMLHNDGRVWLRYVYEHSKGSRLELIYSEDGKLNQKYLYEIGSDGNETASSDFDAFEDPSKATKRYRYRYDKFDSLGNWTQRTKLEVVSGSAGESVLPSYVSFRSITYYP